MNGDNVIHAWDGNRLRLAATANHGTLPETGTTMKFTTAIRACAALLGIAAMAMAGPAFGQSSVEDFYHGKILTIVVSADAGTPTDIIARQFARFFTNYIPGKPRAVVMNVVGAGGMVAAASLQTRQPNDGSVIGFLQRNNLYIPLLDPRQNRFDPRKVRWLGSLNKVQYTIVSMTRSGVTTADDLTKKKMYIGATGFANEDRTLPALLDEYIGAKMSVVPGYTGRGEVYLAMQRGEVDGWASTVDGLQQGEPVRMLADGKMKVLLHLGWTSPAPFADVPNLSTYITDPNVKALFNLFLLPFDAGRPIAVPQGVPQDRLDALREAFAKTIADPAFIEAMKRSGFPIDPIDGNAVEQIVSKLYATPAPQIESARKLIFSSH
jgi:tripartite-type tricarboxylate transporter receptor subunit TctC